MKRVSSYIYRRLAFEVYGFENKCSRCGKLGEIGKPLHIHHKDENPLNNEEYNLESLCISCHISHHHKGKIVSEATREKIALRHKGLRYNIGYKHTELTKQRMSLASKGKPKSEEHKKKIAESRIGKTFKREGRAFTKPE